MRYAGRIYPVNPGRETVLGHRAGARSAELPEAPDHAYIVTPTDAAIEAVAECGRIGVKVATVLADGFAEAGAWGEMRMARLTEICRSIKRSLHAIDIFPNCPTRRGRAVRHDPNETRAEGNRRGVGKQGKVWKASL